MNKIPTLFTRDPENMSRVTHGVTPGCGWVLAGEGAPTRKMDGTNICISFTRGETERLTCVEKRRNPKRAAREQGAVPKYVPCPREDPSNKWIWAAVDATDFTNWPDEDAYPCEALGPKINGGNESVEPMLYPFSWKPESVGFEFLMGDFYMAVEDLLEGLSIEGIVWHHPDGRMAKIKRKDFGLAWPVKEEQ